VSFRQEEIVTKPQNDSELAFRSAAETLKAAAEKLERAAAHCRIASKHFTDRDVPRGCAHAYAALGDIAVAREAIEQNSKVHAEKSVISADPGRSD
jgi:1-aminocyclopropane-1-carboxylate deaminase/D-cysteine desulfhydrase-like pyridoxal-dependent ACC family enzyme